MTLTTWTTLLKITRRDGVVLGICELDRDVVHDGVTYISGAGYTPTVLTSSADLAVNNADVEGILSLAGVARDDIAAGLYDKARIELRLFDYVGGTVVKILAVGHWGNVTLREDSFVAEFRSLAQGLQQTIGRSYTPTCTAELGDDRCKVDIGTLTEAGLVAGVTDPRTIVDPARIEADGFWRGGLIEFLDGPAEGFRMEVKDSASSGVLVLFQALPVSPQVGDAYSLSPGCDKTFSTCKSRYDNVVNFRGYPHIPGADQVLKFGGQS